jgi:hypothetical protein
LFNEFFIHCYKRLFVAAPFWEQIWVKVIGEKAGWVDPVTYQREKLGKATQVNPKFTINSHF